MAPFSILLLGILGLAQHAIIGSARVVAASKIFLNDRDVDKEYDYVIVGGGTAGLTVADRLTEDGKTTVLVIEYGQLSRSRFIALAFYCSL